MAGPTDPLFDPEGPAAPPRSNGELVFAAPWERQVFGMTLALVEAGAFAYAEFQKHLIAEIARWDGGERDRETWGYYHCWSAALETLLAEKGLLATGRVDDLVATLAARPHGHDH